MRGDTVYICVACMRPTDRVEEHQPARILGPPCPRCGRAYKNTEIASWCLVRQVPELSDDKKRHWAGATAAFRCECGWPMPVLVTAAVCACCGVVFLCGHCSTSWTAHRDGDRWRFTRTEAT